MAEEAKATGEPAPVADVDAYTGAADTVRGLPTFVDLGETTDYTTESVMVMKEYDLSFGGPTHKPKLLKSIHPSMTDEAKDKVKARLGELAADARVLGQERFYVSDFAVTIDETEARLKDAHSRPVDEGGAGRTAADAAAGELGSVLNLGYNGLRDSDARELGEKLRDSTQINSVILSHNDFTAAGAAIVLEYLHGHETIKNVWFDSNKLSPDAELDLDDAASSDGEGEEAAATTASASGATGAATTAAGTAGAEADGAAAAAAAATVTTEEQGTGESGEAESEGAAAPAGAGAGETASAATGLETADVAVEEVDPITLGFGRLEEAMGPGLKLHTISLSHNALGLDGVSLLTKILETNTSIKRILYEGNALVPRVRVAEQDAGEPGAAATAIPSPPALRRAESSSAAADESRAPLEELRRALEDNETVEELVLDDCGLYNEGATSVLGGLVNNKTMKKLSIRNNHLSTLSTGTVTALLKTNHTLEELHLDGVYTTPVARGVPEMAREVGEALTDCKLITFTADGMFGTPPEMEAIVAGLKGNTTMKHLSLMCGATQDTIDIGYKIEDLLKTNATLESISFDDPVSDCDDPSVLQFEQLAALLRAHTNLLMVNGMPRHYWVEEERTTQANPRDALPPRNIPVETAEECQPPPGVDALKEKAGVRAAAKRAAVRRAAAAL